MSYFDVEYSRFAWNVNLLPFFVLLFLVSFWHFLTDNSKTAWGWIVLVGLALGVGVQLHAILIFLFPAVIFFDCLHLILKEKNFAWKKMLVILGIALLLNLPPIISEFKHNFSNTQNFETAFLAQTSQNGLPKEFLLDIACNAQANTHIISALGNRKVCDFLYADNQWAYSPATPLSLARRPLFLAGEAVSFSFSLLGVGFLLSYFKKETDRKKRYFLGLIMLYGLLYFLIMLSVAPGSQMRYFLPIIFLPFTFLAFMFDYIFRKYPRWGAWLVAIIFLLLFSTNVYALIFLPLKKPY